MGLTKRSAYPAAWRCVLPLALLCAMSHVAAAQPTSSKAQAQALFEEGRAALEAGDCARAIPLFRESLSTFPARGPLFNLAQCESKLGKVASAWQHLKQLLPQLEPNDFRLASTRQQIEQLEPRVPKLVIELDQGAPAPSVVLLDGAALPQASLGSELPLDPGTHAVVAQWTDGRQTEAPVTLAEGARQILRLAPPPVDAAPPPAVAAPRPVRVSEAPKAASPPPVVSAPSAPASGTQRTVAFVVGGVGTAALVGSLVAGGLALKAKLDLEEECPNPLSCNEDGMSAQSQGQTLTATGTVLGAIGLAGIGAGLVLLLTSPQQGATVALTPAVLPGGGGALLRSRF
ncbi:preprotein translocase subunit TatA [Sorangium sp. So ce296]|uniref:tetratricopeptide repeat protein n=1 Tax=Sorangium sp. So ce296 TaxID=3133296 RepID=UPI003F63DB60